MYSPLPRPRERNPRALGVNGGFEQAAQANTQGIYGREEPDEAERALYELLSGTGQPNAVVPNPNTSVESLYGGGNGLILKGAEIGVAAGYSSPITANPISSQNYPPSSRNPPHYSAQAMQSGMTQNNYSPQGRYPTAPPSHSMPPGQGNFPSPANSGYPAQPYPGTGNQPMSQQGYDPGYPPNPSIPNTNQIPNIQGQGFPYAAQQGAGIAAQGSPPGQGNVPSGANSGYPAQPYSGTGNQPMSQQGYYPGYPPNPSIPNTNQIPNVQGQGSPYPAQQRVGIAAQGSPNGQFGPWAIAGAVAGAMGGYIVANAPGAALGAVAGARIGRERDVTGQPMSERMTPEVRDSILRESGNFLGGGSFQF